MTQVFISYSRTERPAAARLAERLTEAGYSVWWDAELVGGQRFEEEIQSALRAARAVLVLWSKSSLASDWVRAEAEVARVARTAVPVLIDAVAVDDLPLVFRALHAIDLSGWNGDPAAPAFREILGAVEKLVGAPPSPSAPRPPPRQAPRRRWLFAGLAVGGLLLLAGAGWWVLRPAGAGGCAGETVAVSGVPMSVCVTAEWTPTNVEPYQYDSANAQVQFRIIGGPDVLTAQAFRDAIVHNAQRIAGDPARIAIVRDGALTVDGMPWRFIEFTNQGQAAFVNFYYSGPGFGSVQVLFVSSVADVAIRNSLADPVLKSIRDTRR